MLKIRLARLGRKKRPFYRIVATDSRSPRDGKFLEILGTYDPLKEPSETSFNKEKIDDWVNKGAQLSNRVQKIIDPEKNKTRIPVINTAATTHPETKSGMRRRISWSTAAS